MRGALAAARRRLVLPPLLCAWSSSQAELPSFKAALRAVYKKVHPDLFQDWLPAQEANTRSFKLLHEYLEASRTGPRAALPYRFHFFVREGTPHTSCDRPQAAAAEASAARAGGGQPEAAAAGTAAAHGGGGQPEAAAAVVDAADGGSGQPEAAQQPPQQPAGLREVVLTLPPPTRGAPGEAMSGDSRKAFGRLLAALGLPPQFAGGAADGGGGGDDVASRHVSLRGFLPAAVEAVHQHAAAQASAQHRLGALRAALRLGRGVGVGFGGGAAAAGALRQLELLRQLVAALDGLPPQQDLSGLRLMLGQSSGVDALGAVWLAADGSPEEWARHLRGVDAPFCLQRQQLVQGVKAQEAAVAAALGLAMLYPQQPEGRLAPAYRAALERLAAAAAARGPAGGGRFRELPLMLRAAAAEQPPAGGQPAADGNGGGGNGGCCEADSAAGLLVAPLDVAPEALYAAVQQLGGGLLAAAAQRRRRADELAAARSQVERKLMLRRLLRDPSVSDAQYRSCLDRLLAHAQQLSGLLHGTSVRVAPINGLSPDRAVIDVAWNWRM